MTGNEIDASTEPMTGNEIDASTETMTGNKLDALSGNYIDAGAGNELDAQERKIKERSKESICALAERGKQTKMNFVKPTLQEVEAYCTQRNNYVDAHRFLDFYESKGWMIGKNKMKD